MKAVFRAGAALAAWGMAVPGAVDAQDAPPVGAEALDPAKAAALGEAMRAAELWIEGQRRYRSS